MKPIYTQYLNNVVESHRLAKTARFPAAETDDAVLEQIAKNAREAYRLRVENDALLEQLVFSKKADRLTAEEAAELAEFAEALLTFIHQNDAGVAYKIHCLLHSYAKLTGDLDLYIKELYHLGVCLYYLNPMVSEFGINMNGQTSAQYLREGANYLTKMEEIKSEATRSYIIRCVANLFLTDEKINGFHDPGKPSDRLEGYVHFRKLFEEIRGVLESPYYRSLVPDFRWDTMLCNLHFNRCVYYFDLQGMDLPNLTEDILESAEYVYEHKHDAADNSTMIRRINYVYVGAKSRAGQAKISDVVEVLLRDIEGADPNDYSADGVTLNLQLPFYLERAYKLMPKEQTAVYAERVEKAIEGITAYLKNVPFNAYNNVVNEIVGEAVRNSVQNGEPVNMRLFEYLLCCHSPTYIHLHLSAALSRKLFERMIETVPERAVGIYGTNSVEEILARKSELTDKVYECAVCHDVGKILLLNYVEIYNRRLLDEEFRAITLHPEIGAMILKSHGRDDLSCAALYHHCHSDLSGGYPRSLPPCPKEYKLIADIVSVADSLEAATDNIGRCYAAPKSFESVVEELQNFCPVRYSADVVELFNDRGFFEKVKTQLLQERRDTYLDIYREKA